MSKIATAANLVKGKGVNALSAFSGPGGNGAQHPENRVKTGNQAIDHSLNALRVGDGGDLMAFLVGGAALAVATGHTSRKERNAKLAEMGLKLGWKPETCERVAGENVGGRAFPASNGDLAGMPKITPTRMQQERIGGVPLG